MPRFKPHDKATVFSELAGILAAKLKPPFGVVLGSAAETTELVGALPTSDIVCYQMDLYAAAKLGGKLAEEGHLAEVFTSADLWDLPTPVQTLLYAVPKGGERELKLDMVEQAFHVLRPGGVFIVLSPYDKDDFFPPVLKKVFGKVHAPMAGKNAIFWCQRDGDRPRRRHEMTFHVRCDEATSLKFVSRPGTFSYGRFDNGARALVEAIDVHAGDRILDLGCGCGTNGVLAARRGGVGGFVTFVDSNLRAVQLAEMNAKNNIVPAFEAIASCTLQELRSKSYDVVLANPPYFAQLSIARLFFEQGKRCLKPGGRFYLVTRQVEQVAELMQEVFGTAEGEERRGYVVFHA
ncbi:MAG: methyltransferase [Gemmataceae bacterium]|nr:methyltransferase [Gemmataceae bacterium]MCI0738070.1 methyltransferase [Gemmataceae bacterium]